MLAQIRLFVPVLPGFKEMMCRFGGDCRVDGRTLQRAPDVQATPFR